MKSVENRIAQIIENSELKNTIFVLEEIVKGVRLENFVIFNRKSIILTLRKVAERNIVEKKEGQ